MLVEWKDKIAADYKHLNPRKRMMFPVGGGLPGLFVAFGCWYAFALAAALMIATDQNLLMSFQSNVAIQKLLDPANLHGIKYQVTMLSSTLSVDPTYVVFAGVSAIFAGWCVVMTLFGQWMVMSSGSAFAAIWRAVNGHAPTARADVRTILGAGSLLALLLALWLAVFGVETWALAAWNAVLISGTGAALWRLLRPAKYEYFSFEARAELHQATKAAGPLSLVCLVILSVLLGNGRAGIANLQAPWPTMLAIVAAGIALVCYLRVERHLLNAYAIAKREHEARKKAKNDHERGD